MRHYRDFLLSYKNLYAYMIRVHSMERTMKPRKNKAWDPAVLRSVGRVETKMLTAAVGRVPLEESAGRGLFLPCDGQAGGAFVLSRLSGRG